MKALALLAGAALLLAAAAEARADDAASAKAEALFREGTSRFDAHDEQGACDDFLASQELDPELGTLLNLALCHEALGHLALALREYEDGASWAAQRGQKDREAFAHEHVRDLVRRVGRLTFRMPAEAVGYAIALDGLPVGAGRATTLWVDPGPHSLLVAAPGRAAQVVAVEPVSAGDARVVTIPVLAPEATLRESPASPVVVARPADTRGVLALVLGGVGLASVGLGAGLVAHDGRFAPESVAAFGVGGAALGGAGWLLWTRPGGRAWVAPVVGTRATGFAVQGDF